MVDLLMTPLPFDPAIFWPVVVVIIMVMGALAIVGTQRPSPPSSIVDVEYVGGPYDGKVTSIIDPANTIYIPSTNKSRYRQGIVLRYTLLSVRASHVDKIYAFFGYAKLQEDGEYGIIHTVVVKEEEDV